MSRNFPATGSDTFATELHDSRGCRELIPQLNDFENLVFGPDFACDCVQIQPWIDSGCLLYAAVTGEAAAGQRRILSALSIFVTTSAARDRMLLGEIADYEMTPWTSGRSPGQPTLYLSSVASSAPYHLPAMYESLLGDIQDFQRSNGVAFHDGFAIATGTAGGRHMTKSGFRLLDGYRYRRSYQLMVIDARTAATPFWRVLLGAERTLLPHERAANAARSPQRLVAASTESKGRSLERSWPGPCRAPQHQAGVLSEASARTS